MGCGTSSHPPKKKDTPVHSQVTVAAQQRAEAAYRRQRMAQERAEQTAIWRAEMEVERARMLKEMSGGGSRRPSYCKELEDLREEVPEEVCKQMDDYLQDDSVRAKNARNSLPVNQYPRSAAITQRRRSWDERAKPPLRQEKARVNDENGNSKRKLSTGEQIDLDFLRIIANRSGQASPSNVNIEENGQEGDGSENVEKTLDPNVGVADAKQREAYKETPREVLKKTGNALITENKDEDHIPHEPANGHNDPPSSRQGDSSARRGRSTVDDNFEATVQEPESIKKRSGENFGKDSESEHVQDAGGVKIRDSDNNATEVAGDLNAAQHECLEVKEKVGQNEELPEQQQIADKQDPHVELQQESELSKGKGKEQQRGDEENGGYLITDNEQVYNSEQEQQPQAQQNRDKEQKYKETTENSQGISNEPEPVKTMENGRDHLKAQINDTRQSEWREIGIEK